jgi:DNA polymerase-3 subunit chi
MTTLWNGWTPGFGHSERMPSYHTLYWERPEAPVEIGFGEQRPRHRELFVNMALDLPEDAFEFERIVEIVVQEAEILAATRQNYQRCRERGIELHRTDLR